MAHRDRYDAMSYDLPQDERGTCRHFDWQAKVHVPIILSPLEMELTKNLSDERVALSRAVGFKDQQVSEGNADWRGYIGEWAVSRWLGCPPPDPATAIRNPVDLTLKDGTTIDVKSIQFREDELCVYWDIDRPCQVFVLVHVTERSPIATIIGWTARENLMVPTRKRLRPKQTREQYCMMQYELFDIKYLREV